MSCFDEEHDGDPHGECAAEISRLKSELGELRALFPAICAALGNGACCSPDSSIEFLERIPGEVKAVVDELRSKTPKDSPKPC